MRNYIIFITLLFSVLTVSAAAQTGESPGKRRLPQDRSVILEGPRYGATTPQSNEIRCRGYRGVGGGAFVFRTIGTRQSVTGETIVTLEMAFTPALAAAGADGRGLRNPGECAWADRPIGDNGTLRVRFDAVADGQFRQRLHGSTIDTSPTVAERFPDAHNIPVYLQDPNHYWSFFIVSTNQSYHQASYQKFWKPALKIVITKPDMPNSRIDIRH